MLTDRHLALIAPRCPLQLRRLVLPHLNTTLRRYEINTIPRVAAFIGNVLVESGEFLYREEIWGATPAQQRYDVGRKALELGNTPEADGDGKKYKGHGWIQTTGKNNHARVGKHLGIDAVREPELLGQYPYCALSAGFFWQDNKLNQLADQLEGDWDAEELAVFTKTVKRVNGGRMHIERRIEYYRRACHVLRTVPGFGISQVTAPAPVPAALGQGIQPERAPAPTSAPPMVPPGTVSHADEETRLNQTKLIDYAAQQVTPNAARTFARSTGSRFGAPFVKAGGWLMAALQMGHFWAWLGVAVAVAGVGWLVWRYRRPLKSNFYYFWSKVTERFAT
ncbi:MAG: hypothetical protein H0T60_08030 [Acidobacteria bacterium]|nr:hypothetical protein [Acidobacteriota bacterium]